MDGEAGGGISSAVNDRFSGEGEDPLRSLDSWGDNCGREGHSVGDPMLVSAIEFRGNSVAVGEGTLMSELRV